LDTDGYRIPNCRHFRIRIGLWIFKDLSDMDQELKRHYLLTSGTYPSPLDLGLVLSMKDEKQGCQIEKKLQPNSLQKIAKLLEMVASLIKHLFFR